MSELSEKLSFAKELPRHLRELRILLSRVVRREDLLSVDDTKSLLAESKRRHRQSSASWRIPFSAKQEPRFKSYIDRLASANPHDVYVWTPASNACGLVKPIALSQVNLEFPFDLNPEGILTILTPDFSERLLFDYSEDGGDQVLDLEVNGPNWSAVNY